MDSLYFEKQDICYSYCIGIDLPTGNWERYRFINNQFVKCGNSEVLLSSVFSICCFYKEPYSKHKGKKSIFSLFNNYMQIKTLNACLSKVDDIDYLRVLFILEKIKEKYPNVVVYCPRKTINSWKKYLSLHLQPFSERLKSFNIACSFEPTSLPLTNADAIVFFELSSDANTIDNNINEIVHVYNQQPPALLYISFYTEVGKDGKLQYFKKEEIGKMFKQY